MDKTSCEHMIESHYPRIRRAALVLSGSPSEADDLAQETFLEAMRSWRRYAGTSSEQTWLYGILLNVSRRSRRRRNRAWRKLRHWLAVRQGGDSLPEERLVQEEWQASLWSAVAQLSSIHQQVVVLRYSESLPLAEIGEILNCPTGTVKSRLHNALKELRSQLSPKWDDAIEPAALVIRDDRPAHRRLAQ